VKLTLFRAGKKQTVSVTLAKKEMPPLPPRFVPGFRKVTTFEGEPIASLRASRPGPVSVGAKTLRPAEMRISKFEGKSSAMFFDDGAGRLEISFKDGKKQLKARDAKGDVVFNGPVETPEDRKALPADVRARLEKMEAMDVHIPAPPAGEIHEFRSEPGAFSPGPFEGGERDELEFFGRPLPAMESDVV
jgi:serine protease Do